MSASQRLLSFAGDNRVYADFCQVAIWLIDWSEIERQLSKVLRLNRPGFRGGCLV